MPGRFPALNRPSGVGIDPAGSIYVGDAAGNERVVRLGGDSTPLSEIGGPGALGGATLAGNAAVAVSPVSHGVYVADTGHNRILVFGADGRLLGRWGAGGGNGAAGSGPGSCDHRPALAIDGAGDIDVADTGNDRIVRLDPSGNVIAEWGATGGGDGRFRSPNGVGVDGAGNVYVLDGENNRVQVFDESGHYKWRWGSRGIGVGQFSQAAGLAVGCEGSVYVADTNNNRIERFEPQNRTGTGCVPASAWPPPLDVAPVLTVKLLRSRGVLARRSLALSVSCRRGCKVLVTATLPPAARPRHAVRLPALARGLPAARTRHLSLRISAAALRRLPRHLRAP